jgi:hypothetical protein
MASEETRKRRFCEYCARPKQDRQWSRSAASTASSQQSVYLWKKKYAGLGLNELRELRQLREENKAEAVGGRPQP